MSPLAEALAAVESLMLAHFRDEPFHNLGLLYGERVRAELPGGTCSDKTLSFVAAAKRAGFDASLHSGSIGGREIHRLARLRVAERDFFADVGNGWPALRLYPADRPIRHRAFGMVFRTEVSGERVVVFHERLGKESVQLEFEVRARSQRDVMRAIERRFSSGIDYPFSESLRFAQVLGDRFLFLRGTRLEIYGDDGSTAIEGLTDVAEALLEHFGYDLRTALCGAAPRRESP